MKPTREQIEKAARRYVKLVEWCEADQCYIGSAPPLIGQSCHGATEAGVLAELNRIVDEWLVTLLARGRPLPVGTANKEYSGKFIVRIPPAVHRKSALKALARGDILNQYVANALAEAFLKRQKSRKDPLRHTSRDG